MAKGPSKKAPPPMPMPAAKKGKPAAPPMKGGKKK